MDNALIIAVATAIHNIGGMPMLRHDTLMAAARAALAIMESERDAARVTLDQSREAYRMVSAERDALHDGRRKFEAEAERRAHQWEAAYRELTDRVTTIIADAMKLATGPVYIVKGVREQDGDVTAYPAVKP